MMIWYVTYDEDGNLTGFYLQVPQPAHLDCMIEVDESYSFTWNNYRANAARDGIELIPPAPPVDPEQTEPYNEASAQPNLNKETS